MLTLPILATPKSNLTSVLFQDLWAIGREVKAGIATTII